MSSFSFTDADAWDVSTDTLLPEGNHLVHIVNPTMGQTRNGNPQLELKVENSQGSLQDWLVITANSVGKIAMLFDAAGAMRPQDGEFDPSTGRLSDACIGRLHEKKVGIVVRDELFEGKTRTRIQGYVKPERITGGGGSASAGSSSGGVPVGTASAQEDIPFLWDESPTTWLGLYRAHNNREN